MNVELNRQPERDIDGLKGQIKLLRDFTERYLRLAQFEASEASGWSRREWEDSVRKARAALDITKWVSIEDLAGK